MSNASEYEWVWTIANAIAFLSCLWVGVRRTWRGVRALRHEHDRATVWLFVQRLGQSVIFLVMTIVFVLVGIRSMGLPPTANSSDVVVMAFTVVALLVAAYNVMLVLSDPMIDRAVMGQASALAEEKVENRAEGYAEGRAEAELEHAGLLDSRHANRDEGRDTGRDPVRDLARDEARDEEERQAKGGN